MVIILIGLVEASPCWLVLGLAIAIVDPFNCCNAERFRMHIKMDIFLHNPKHIKLPVLYAPTMQITSSGVATLRHTGARALATTGRAPPVQC